MGWPDAFALSAFWLMVGWVLVTLIRKGLQ